MGPLEFMSWSPSSKIYTSPGRLGGSCRRQLKTTATAPHNTRCHLPYTSYLLYRTRAAYDITNSTVQHSTAQYSTARHGTAQHSTAHHSTQPSTAQHTAKHSPVRHGTNTNLRSTNPHRTFKHAARGTRPTLRSHEQSAAAVCVLPKRSRRTTGLQRFPRKRPSLKRY